MSGNIHFRNSLVKLLVVICTISCNKDITIIDSIKCEGQPETRASLFSEDSKENCRDTFVDDKDIFLFFEKNYKEESIKQIIPYIYKNETVFYAVNLLSGWKIVSADTRIPEILAYSEKGAISFEQNVNSAFSFWIEEWAEQIYQMIKEDTTLKAESKPMLTSQELLWTRITNHSISSTTVESIGPLLSTSWGQKSPWNYKCPVFGDGNQSPTGCVSVALSQIIYYNNRTYGIPSGLYHNIDCSNVYGDEIKQINLIRSDHHNPSSRWNDMPLNKYGLHTDYVGDLMMDVGAYVNMDYYSYRSSADLPEAYDALNNYSLSADLYYNDYNSVRILNNLRNSHPMYIEARSSNSGHAWVVDGFNRIIDRSTDYYMYIIAGPNCTGELFTTSELRQMYPDEKIEDGLIVPAGSHDEIRDYIHMNWGDDGDANGFFLEGLLVPWTNGEKTYLDNKRLIYDIQPFPGLITQETTSTK